MTKADDPAYVQALLDRRNRLPIWARVNTLSVIAAFVSVLVELPAWVPLLSVWLIVLLSPTISITKGDDVYARYCVLLAVIVANVLMLVRATETTLLLALALLFVSLPLIAWLIVDTLFDSRRDSEWLNSNSRSPARGHGCFPANLRISTPEGMLPIDRISIGSLVWSFDVTECRRIGRQVVAIKAHPEDIILRFEIRGEIPFRANRHHSILTSRGWRKAGDLQVKDELILCDGDGPRVCTIAVIRKEPEPLPVYNLICDQEHILICNGVITHNFTLWRTARVRLSTGLGRLQDALDRCGPF